MAVEPGARRARSWVATAASLALLVAALVPKFQGGAINRAMLYPSLLFAMIAAVWRRRDR